MISLIKYFTRRDVRKAREAFRDNRLNEAYMRGRRALDMYEEVFEMATPQELVDTLIKCEVVIGHTDPEYYDKAISRCERANDLFGVDGVDYMYVVGLCRLARGDDVDSIRVTSKPEMMNGILTSIRENDFGGFFNTIHNQAQVSAIRGWEVGILRKIRMLRITT
jgi:hypothetical protein